MPVRESLPPRIAILRSVFTSLTAYLNDNSEWFENHCNPKVVALYDDIKTLAAHIRNTWPD